MKVFQKIKFFEKMDRKYNIFLHYFIILFLSPFCIILSLLVTIEENLPKFHIDYNFLKNPYETKINLYLSKKYPIFLIFNIATCPVTGNVFVVFTDYDNCTYIQVFDFEVKPLFHKKIEKPILVRTMKITIFSKEIHVYAETYNPEISKTIIFDNKKLEIKKSAFL